MNKKIKSALISVFYKDNLEPIVKKLNDLGVTIFSTGGTQEFIEKLGGKVTPVEELTSYPSILGGRVKFHIIQPVVENQKKRSPACTSLWKCRYFRCSSRLPPWEWVLALGTPVVPEE